MVWSAVIGVSKEESIEEWNQPSALPRADGEGVGEVGAQSNHLLAVTEEVCYRGAGGNGEVRLCRPVCQE